MSDRDRWLDACGDELHRLRLSAATPRQSLAVGALSVAGIDRRISVAQLRTLHSLLRAVPNAASLLDDPAEAGRHGLAET